MWRDLFGLGFFGFFFPPLVFPVLRNSFSCMEPPLALCRKRNTNSHLCFLENFHGCIFLPPASQVTGRSGRGGLTLKRKINFPALGPEPGSWWEVSSWHLPGAKWRSTHRATRCQVPSSAGHDIIHSFIPDRFRTGKEVAGSLVRWWPEIPHPGRLITHFVSCSGE